MNFLPFFFFIFFFNENNNADIFNDPELILEIKWSINLKKKKKKLFSNKFLYIFPSIIYISNRSQFLSESIVENVCNLDRKGKRKKFAHSPIQFLQTAQEIDRLGHILYSFHRFDLKRFVPRLQTLIDLLQPEQTWKGRDEIYSGRFESRKFSMAVRAVRPPSLRIILFAFSENYARTIAHHIGRYSLADGSVWPAVHAPNVSRRLHRNHFSNLVIRWRVIVWRVRKKEIFIPSFFFPPSFYPGRDHEGWSRACRFITCG